MRFSFIVMFFCLMAFTTSAHARFDEPGVPPEEIMKLKNIDILGINLTMTMGEIMAKLAAQGYKLDCSRGRVCSATGPEYTIRIEHKLRSFNQATQATPIDKSAPPYSISYSQVLGNPKNCAFVHRAVDMFCKAGVTKLPCRQDNMGLVTADIWSKARHSPDGYQYQSTITLKPPQRCTIKIGRRLVVSPADTAATTGSASKDITANYIELCSGHYKHSASFCGCSLNAFSTFTRDRRQKKLPTLKMIVNGQTQGFLSDPATTKSKIDAVCDLHDLANENKKLGSQTKDRQKKREYTLKKLDLLEKKRSLAESYKLAPQTAGALLQGNYCDDRHELRQVLQDQAESADLKETGQYYGELRRYLEEDNGSIYGHILKAGTRAKCPE